MRPAAYIAVLFSLLVGGTSAEPVFEPLSGRVVDTVGFMENQARSRLEVLLLSHEKRTGDQVVFTSVPDLQGYDIETFGYQLARHWEIGQRDKNNGVVLIVAKAERKVRIEVGYGLEAVLTDAISANILQTIILSEFKKGNFERGIELGMGAILEVLAGEYAPRKRTADRGFPSPLIGIVLCAFVLFVVMNAIFGEGGGSSNRPRMNGDTRYGGGLRGRSRGGFSGGGFRGGGGSFGGGGASGGW